MFGLHSYPLAFITNLFDSPTDWIVILIIAVLLFGRRLPEIGKSLGRTIVEFKKGLSQTTDEISQAAHEDVEEKPRQKSPLPTAKPARQIKQIPSTTIADEP